MTIDDCNQRRAWELKKDKEVFIPQLDLGQSKDYVGSVMQFSPDARYLVDAGRNRSWLGIFFVFNAESPR